MSATDDVRARVREAGGEELLERLEHLDAIVHARPERAPAPPVPRDDPRRDFDVIIAGGGLWLLVAPMLAERGLRVAVLERARAGVSHREWNASGPELQRLVETGLLTPAELESMVVARYRAGICRFHGGGRYEVQGALDHAVDAGALLRRARDLARSRGVVLLDGHSVVSHAAGRECVAVRARRGGSAVDGVDLVASVLVDARGAASPHATADLVCPTVGGVLRGLVEGDAPDEVKASVGEILVTVDPVKDGRQHVWEGFPGRPGEITTYLFYYARAGERVSLTALYARFFRELATYKRGDATLSRPTFGLIPGWSRLSPPPSSGSPRVVLVGDAASRHSPLTYCGFGATLRSLSRAADAIARVADGSDEGSVVDDAPIHALTGVLAHVLASRELAGQEQNELIDAAFAVLHEMGPEPYARLLRDEMDAATFVRFLRRTAARHPHVWGKIARTLRFGTMGRWGLGLARTFISSHA